MANKGGRPPALTDAPETMKALKGLGRIQATTKESAAVLGVSEPTFIAFLKRFPGARDVYEMGKEEGKVSLRRLQFRLAERNAAMAIFLGKNHLGQRDDQAAVAVQVNVQVNNARDKLAHLIDREATGIKEADDSRTTH